MKLKRVLVTGGAGFIGSHTVRRLLETEAQVVVLDNLSSGAITNLDLSHPNLDFVEGDILEYPLLVDLIEGCDAVLHLAAIASVPLSIEDPVYTFQVNTQGFLHVLEAVRTALCPARLVYASSAAVYGDATVLPCDDTKPLISTPLSPYALQKIENESYAALYKRLHAQASLGLRYFNVYGQGQDPHSPYSGVISRFMEEARQGKALAIYGDGLQSRDFIHVNDIANANVLALQSDYHGVLNVATGKPETLLNLVKYIESACGTSIATGHLPARPGDILHSYGTVSAAETQLGFKAAINLQSGIKTLL